jgi:hypothetical protein
MKKSLALLCAALVSGVAFSSTTGLLASADGEVLPENCGGAFPDIAGFLTFFDTSLSYMAAKRGATAKGVAELFAVSELRSSLDAKIPNPTGESVMDRLIVSQLCQFRQIYLTENPQQGLSGRRVLIDASNDSLHDHLSKIAPMLYKDARDHAEKVLMEIAKNQRRNELLERKREEIRKARAGGRARVADLID